MIALEIVEGGKGTRTLGEGRKGDGRGCLIKTKDEKRTAFADLTAQPRPTRERNGAATHAQNANGALRATRGRAASWIIHDRGNKWDN